MDSDQRPCADPECSGVAELERDGEHCTYWACSDCGFEFDYQLTDSEDPTCQIGVPEPVRRLASQAAQRVLDDGKPVLQIGRRPPE